MRCVVRVSVVERSGCLVIPFIVPVSYKMDYDQGVIVILPCSPEKSRACSIGIWETVCR